MHLFLQHGLIQYVNEQKFNRFLALVYGAYRREVQYHNDLHGIDVAHMAHLFLTEGGMIQLAELDHIDIMALLTAGVCHDLGHDGFTNAYHVNTFSDRATRYNDISVQENYHAAESFAIIKAAEANFLETLTPDEFKVFRKRMIGCILATDMAKHAADLSQLKSIVEAKQIRQGQNADLVINRESDATLFKSQQFLLEITLHACDISQQTRPFDTVRKWTELLYDEFFHQGDLEKQKGLPVSFLCDRVSTDVPKMQPGFINGITIPLWSVLVEVMPSMGEYLKAARENCLKWESFDGGNADKKQEETKTNNISQTKETEAVVDEKA